MLRRLHFTLLVSREARDRIVPTVVYRGLSGFIGVHGGALANLHACAPGTRVVEILGEANPRWCYASLSHRLRLNYSVYYPTRFPPDYHAWGTAGQVVLDQNDFLRFVADAFS